ncbi:DUF3102 domain-containing protein [Sinorhizobium psoraleae]|uniref:DUF3102 domain-containing protein n=1 Tax=Sinorhizobium psoraleae TaxID=520838 RepID=A0ABT4KK42_9HYPH|nr:DUF3102 domain-containing protein [Sinorhizobium psoraleae]MCZ4091696.1 DUF3102 domain-containing protein [Sinorhizobium psoraleae]
MSETLVRALCQEFGIEIVPKNVSAKPFQTRAVNTLKQIRETRGDAHLRLVLTTLAETKGAQAPLEAYVIWAASDLVTACSEFIERDASAWLEMWDRLPLGWIATSHLRGITDQRRALTGAIYMYMFKDRRESLTGLKATAAASRHVTITHEQMVKYGRELLKVKAELPHGQWLYWLRNKSGLPEQTARKYMRMAREADAQVMKAAA